MIAYYLALSLVKALVRFTGGIFALKGRLCLSKYLHSNYISKEKFYSICTENEIDNPDQRISQDVERFMECVRKLLESLVIDPFLIAYYTYSTAAINGAVTPLIPLIFEREAKEGYFRYIHVRIRQFSESISFLNGEHFERLKADGMLDSLLGVQKKVLEKGIAIKFFTEFFNFFGAIVSYLIIAIPIFTGVFDNKSKAELSQIISLNSFTSMYLIYKFTVITDLTDVVGDLAGYTSRLGQFIEVLEKVQQDKDRFSIIVENDAIADTEYFNNHFKGPNSNCIILEKVSVKSPDGEFKFLIRNLNLKLNPGENLLITGSNGSGKSLLLKMLAKFDKYQKYDDTGSTIFIPSFPKVMFVPQIVYLPEFSSINEILGYGCMGNDSGFFSCDVNCVGYREFGISDVLDCLEKVKLTHIIKRIKISGEPLSILSEKFEVATLSPGEKQRLLIARIMLWKPVWAIIDEGLSNIDEDGCKTLFKYLEELKISLIVVEHQDANFFLDNSSLNFKNLVISNDNNGSWRLI
ncbi:ATP-binding cassette sub- D member 4 [Lobulomyces angularis]|nr:ATP-binding cassette sub- D member 4 [Lobulomyces angularis]